MTGQDQLLPRNLVTVEVVAPAFAGVLGVEAGEECGEAMPGGVRGVDGDQGAGVGAVEDLFAYVACAVEVSRRAAQLLVDLLSFG